MSRSNCTTLDTGDDFPHMEFNAVGGGKVRLPEDFGERWNVLLFYRGHW
jgi:alkyl hydroperoxide reductase subunit AhpC